MAAAWMRPMASPAAHLIALLVSAVLFGGTAVRQTEVAGLEEAKLPPKVHTIVHRISAAKLFTQLDFVHKHSLCTTGCGKGVGNMLLTESKCLDLREGDCIDDPSLENLGPDEGTGKNRCVYTCPSTSIPVGSMCCSYQGQAGWIVPWERYESDECPPGFTEESEHDKCGEKMSEYKMGRRSNLIRILSKPYGLVEPCNQPKCGGMVNDGNLFYAVQLKHCLYWATVDTCPQNSAFYNDEGTDATGKRRCLYECSGGQFEIPRGSICCESGWVFPARQQLDETGSAVCPDGESEACDANSHIDS